MSHYNDPWALCHIIMMTLEWCVTLWWPMHFVSHYYDDPWTLCHIIMTPELCVTLLWWPLSFVSHYYNDPWTLCHIIMMTLELCVTLLWWPLKLMSHLNYNHYVIITDAMTWDYLQIDGENSVPWPGMYTDCWYNPDRNVDNRLVI